MTQRKFDLDLVKQVQEKRERLKEIQERKEEIKQEAKKRVDGPADSPPEELEEEWEELDKEETVLEGEVRKFIEASVDWTCEVDVTSMDYRKVKEKFEDVDSCAFTVQELDFGQLQKVSDDMVEESFEVDVQKQELDGTPRQGYYKSELLRESIVEWPPFAPTYTNEHGRELSQPGDFPVPVSEWLYDRVDAINTTGDTEMGNSSLKEAMTFKE